MDPVIAKAPLTATGHPLQRAGAWAVAVLAGQSDPSEITAKDLDHVAAAVVEEACTAAVAPKDGGPAYEWWKVLLALYPNSKATHSTRSKEPGVIRGHLNELFAADDAGACCGPCTFCGADASVLWTKVNLPLFDTNKALNLLPPGMRGWPVCRGCRIAMWALPYGAWVTAGSATVLSCESDAAIAQFTRRNVQRARRIMQAGFTGMPAGARAEYVALAALRDAAADLCATTLWTFKNDNQEPWLRVTHTRRAVPVFLAKVDGNATLRRGWHLLAGALTRFDKKGKISASGAQEAARLLFEAEDGRGWSLLRQLFELLKETDRSWPPGGREALARLGVAYAEEVLGMTPNESAVATLLTEWIARGTSPRARFAEYRNAALSDYRLGMLLMQAYSRLLLDGQAPELAGPKGWEALIQRRPRAWEQRMLLFAQVSVLLQQRGVAVSEKPASPEEQQRLDALEDQPLLDENEFDYMMGPA
ncbi:hypothetical protein [Streptomyces sclerotialus]|uniref:hypothetical protein n=1 Tax=Streptomyces sclerotialus TaxID=1957 RepID=UPI0004CBAD32